MENNLTLRNRLQNIYSAEDISVLEAINGIAVDAHLAVMKGNMDDAVSELNKGFLKVSSLQDEDAKITGIRILAERINDYRDAGLNLDLGI